MSQPGSDRPTRRRRLGPVLAAALGCALVGAALAGCGQGTTDGRPSADAPSTTGSATSVSSTTTSPAITPSAGPSTPSAGPSVVTVTALPPRRHRRTVTRVAPPPQPDAPSSTQALRQLVDESDAVDTSDYYDGDALFFDSPSQNIGCYLYSDYVTCSITRYDFPQPGHDCDAGIAATVDSSGSPSLTDCSGYFHVADEGAVLPYGDELVNGDFACVSQSTGLSCADTDTDTGFTLSRQVYTPVY